MSERHCAEGSVQSVIIRHFGSATLRLERRNAYNVFTYSINCFFCSGVRFVPKL